MPVRVRRISEHDPRRTGPESGWLGQLAPVPGASPDDQIRGACDRCGAHVLVTRAVAGELLGMCPVCLHGCFTAVEDHPVAG